MEWGKIPATIAARWRGLSLWARFAIVIFFAVIVIGGIYIFKKSAPVAQEAPHLRAVQVASVTDLQNDSTPLPLVGEVQSVNEAQIHSQVGGTITHLYRKLGEYVPAGGIIAEIDNASERAAVLSAQGALEAAQASLAKASGSTASNSEITSSQASESAENAKNAAFVALQSTYAALDDAVHTKADTLFSNPRTLQPLFVLSIADNQLAVDINNARVPLEDTLKDASAIADGASSADVDDSIEKMMKHARSVLAFLNNVITAVNKAQTTENISASALAADQTLMGAARTEVTSAIASLNTAKNAYDAARASAQSAANSAGSANTHDIAAAQASLKSAQGSYDAANANLEKTIIRAPISGTLNNLSIHLGDFVAGFQQVAVVSNNGALEIVAHITPEDRATIAAGSKVRIENEYDGIVSTIAPAIDPTTKKIELKVSFNGRAQDLTNGEAVHLDIARTPKKTVQASQIALPIAAVKIGTESSVVFTVGADNKLVAHRVKTGDLIGDKIVITDGVTSDMMLVTDARGLKDGQEVDLQ